MTNLVIVNISAGLVGEQEGDDDTELNQVEAHTSSADCDEEEDGECDFELDKSDVGTVEFGKNLKLSTIGKTTAYMNRTAL